NLTCRGRFRTEHDASDLAVPAVLVILFATLLLDDDSSGTRPVVGQLPFSQANCFSFGLAPRSPILQILGLMELFRKGMVLDSVKGRLGRGCGRCRALGAGVVLILLALAL